ncbi:MAG: hypothetical protein HKN99_11650 [Winogradskyella sp.]|nr:hypothetical protein [Winogradskyella sp.]NNC46528.1 hypothetical protein [Winogradskyella sp.]NNF86290.1 hypothetical protein [Winogradskyella sp.]NNK40047.1 hypothetical protein [Winogradskyella sp.]
MNPVLRNILAVITGIFGGSIVNMALVEAGHKVFPIVGLDPSDMEAYADIMPTLDFEYFIFPFLAHAVGTLVGALIAGIIGVNIKMRVALIVGIFFFIAGVAVNIMLPGPTWFAAVDILLAYIPMAYFGGKMAIRFAKSND